MEVLSIVMLGLYGGGLALVAGIGVARQILRQRQKRRIDPQLRRLWRTAASRLQWSEVEESRPVADPPWLTAKAGELEIRLERGWLETTPCTRIVVQNLGHGKDGLAVRHRDAQKREKRLFEPAVKLGVLAFDEPFCVVGSASLAQAVLDWETRGVLGDLMAGSLAVPGQPAIQAAGALTADTLEVRVPHETELGETALRQGLDQALAGVFHLVERLARPRDLAGRLIANLGEEPEAEVRRRTLELLCRECGDDPRTRAAVLAVREDPSPEVRFEAAVACGRDGHDTLRALVANPATSDALAADAVVALGVWWSVEAATEGLRAALRRSRTEVARAALDTLGRHARLGRRGDAALEGQVVRTLAHIDPAVCVAAAQALGQLGSAAAVPALRAAEERGHRELARAARQSIGEIQARLGGAEHGQLSLADGEAGALSLAGDGEAGRLSLDEPRSVER